MTKEKILEIFETWCRKHCKDYKAALDYVSGDDEKFSQIIDITGKYTGFDDDLIKELDGENAEFAARCMKASAALRYQNIILKPDDVGLLKRLGFNLSYILKSQFDYFNIKYASDNYKMLIPELIRCFADEAETVVTADFSGSPDNKHAVSFHLACRLAAEAVKLNKFSDSSEKKIMPVLEAYLQHGGALEVLVCIYPKSENCAEMLRDKMPGCLINIYNYLKDHNEVRKLTKDLGCEKYYIFYSLRHAFGEAAYKEVSDELLNDENNLIECIGALEEVNSISLYYMSDIAGLIIKNLKNGQGTGSLEIFAQKYYKLLLSELDCIDSSILYSKAELQHMPEYIADYYKDPETGGSYYKLVGSARHAVRILSGLSNYCSIAASLILSVLKAAAGEERKPDVCGVLIYEYLKAVQPYECEAVCNKLTELLGEGMSVNDILKAVYVICRDNSSQGSIFSSAVSLFVSKYQDETARCTIKIIQDYYTCKDEKTSSDKWCSYYAVLYLSKLLYRKCGYIKFELLFELFTSTSLYHRKFASEFMLETPELFAEYMFQNLSRYSGDILKNAQLIIKKADAVEKEIDGFISDDEVISYVSKNYNKRLAAKIKQLPDILFDNVRFADLSQTAPCEIIKYIYAKYIDLGQICEIKECSKIAGKLNKNDLSRCADTIYKYWLENDADVKLKMVLLPLCLWGSDSIILGLKNRIIEWNKAQRKVLAVFACEVCALNGGKCALMMLSQITDKFPENIVGKTAKAALMDAAGKQGLNEEQLADKIIPSLGLDMSGKVTASYGSRTFTITLMSDFTVQIKDDSKNKVIKTLPKPGVSDDADKAQSCKKLVSELRKQLKSVCALQKRRLYFAFRSGRTWSKDEWNEIFAENPVMQVFARNLVWGVYDNGKLVSSFRPADDDTLCDVNDNETALPDNAVIALVHPVDMEPGEVRAWLSQLEDYEIKQPFAQMSANIITVNDNDIDSNMCLTKYKGASVTVGALKSCIDKYGLVRGDAGDGGSYYGYELRDIYLKTAMIINSNDLFFGQSSDETVKIEGINFIKILDDKPTNVPTQSGKTVSPTELSTRFVSCCLDMLESILD